MSPIGRPSFGDGGVAGVPAKFENTLFVGNDFAGVDNVFTSIQDAIDYINGLTGAAVPSFTNKFVILDFESQSLVTELFLPDWVWLGGRGQDNTAIAESAASGDYIISVGVGGLFDFSVIVGLIAGDDYPQMIQARDSQSLYTPLQEPFADLDGTELEFKVDGSTVVVIEFAEETTTAAEVAAAINTQGAPDLWAIDSFGRVRVRGVVSGRDVLLELLEFGDANTLLGWPEAGTQTIDPLTELEFRIIKNVQVLAVGTGVEQKYAVSVEDVSSQGTFIEKFRVQGSLLPGGINGIRFAGGILNVISPEFRTTGVGCDLYDDGISPVSQQELVLLGGLFLDNVNAPTHIRFNESNIRVTVAASSYDPQKVRSGITSQPINITGVTIDFYSEDVPFGADGISRYVVEGTTLSWEAPGETVAGPLVDVGAGGSFILTADGGSTMNVTVAAGSLPGTDQQDTIEVFEVNVDPITQAGSIRLADPFGFFGPFWGGKPVEDAVAQLATEIRSVSLSASEASVVGITPSAKATDGLINGFATKVHSDSTDQKAVWEIKLANVAAYDNRNVFLDLETIIASAHTGGLDQGKFNILAKYVNDGDDLTGAEDETLSIAFTVGVVNDRKDVSIQLDESKLAGNQKLRFGIERDTGVGNNTDVNIHLTGITVRL